MSEFLKIGRPFQQTQGNIYFALTILLQLERSVTLKNHPSNVLLSKEPKQYQLSTKLVTQA